MSVVLKVVDRKSTRLNSSHLGISYAVFCLKKKIRVVVVELLTGLPARALGAPLFVLQLWIREGVNVCLEVLLGELLAGLQIRVFFNDTATTEIYTLSLHDALPI